MAYVPPHRRASGANKTAQRSVNSFARRMKGCDDDASPEESLDCVVSRVVCINLDDRQEKWSKLLRQGLSGDLRQRIDRFSAINGKEALEDQSCYDGVVQLDWDSSINARYSSKAKPGPRRMTAGEVGCALSHIALWRQIAASVEPCEGNDDPKAKALFVLEDDAIVTRSQRWERGWVSAHRQLPDYWGILYLGFSDRGERTMIESQSSKSDKAVEPIDRMEVFVPEYGFHTHAYWIRPAAAQRLLSNLPVVGPIDVWLADNKWFGIPVFCTVIPDEGWQRADGSYEGGLLVRQDRRRGYKSDVAQSSEQNAR